MPVAENAILRIIAQFNLKAESKAQNVYHVQNDTTDGCTDQEAIDGALAYVQNIMSNLTTRIDNDVSLELVEVYEWGGVDWGPVGTKAGTWVGTSANDQLPAGVACMLQAFKPRSGYADKKFIAGITDDQAVGDVWGAGLLTDAESAADDWVAEYTDGTITFTPVSWSQKVKTHQYYTGDVAVSNIASYQRRRKPGVGL